MINNEIINCVSNLINKLNLIDYIGILVYGSYVGDRANSLSDLDVMIIKDNYRTQDCGSLLIDGIRVEYFVQDLTKLYKLINQEIDNNDPSHLTKFATCKILYDSENKVADFIDYAKNLYNTKIFSSFDDNDKFSVFSIYNKIEDLESLIDNESFYATYYVILEKIRTLYAKVNGIIDLPIMKIEKLYTDKKFAKKYISSSIHCLPNKEFINLYLQCIKIDNKEKMLSKIKKIYNYSFEKYDFDCENFCLKFIENSPFRV